MIRSTEMRPLWTQKIASHPVGIALQEGSPNGAMIGIEGEVYFFNPETGRMSKRIMAHKGGNTAIAANSLLSEFATGGEDGFIRLWGRQSQAPIWEHYLGKDWVEAIAASPVGHLAAGAGRALCVWNVERELILQRTMDHPIRHVHFMNHGTELLISTARQSLFITLNSNEVLTSFSYDASPFQTHVSPDELWLAAGMADMGVRLFNLRSISQEALGIGPFSNKPKHICWSPESRDLAAANGDRVYLINRTILATLAAENRHEAEDIRQALTPLDYVQGKTTALQFHGTEQVLAIGTDEGNLVVEDLEMKLPLLNVFVEGGAIVQLAWTADSDRLIYATESGSVGCFWVPVGQSE